MRRARIWLWVGALGLFAGVVAAKDRVWPNNFREVEDGAVYRGGEQRAWPLKRLIRRHGLRTIVCLADPPPGEQAVADALGVRWYYLPINESSADATFDRLEKVAGIVADPSNRPVFFHCNRGVYRSNLAQAVYRMKECGWPLDRVIDELQAAGFDPAARGGDSSCGEFLARYHTERVIAQMAMNKHEDRP
jgi:protein tyrosine/serine phosphatase